MAICYIVVNYPLDKTCELWYFKDSSCAWCVGEQHLPKAGLLRDMSGASSGPWWGGGVSH